MNATKPIEPKTRPPMRFAPLKTGMAFFELIPRQQVGTPRYGVREKVLRFSLIGGRRSAPSLPENLMIDPRCAALPRFFSGNVNRRNDMASQLFKTKSPELLLRESEHPDRVMKRSLSAFALTCLGVGAIIGSGIFVLTGTAAGGPGFFSRFETPALNFFLGWGDYADAGPRRSRAGPAGAGFFFGGG